MTLAPPAKFPDEEGRDECNGELPGSPDDTPPTHLHPLRLNLKRLHLQHQVVYSVSVLLIEQINSLGNLPELLQVRFQAGKERGL